MERDFGEGSWFGPNAGPDGKPQHPGKLPDFGTDKVEADEADEADKLGERPDDNCAEPNKQEQ